MQIFKRLDNTDRNIVSTSSFLALLLAFWLFYDVFYLDPKLQGQLAIGKISETQNKVKRKFNRSLVWYQAQQNDTVYENDWIFTGSNSVVKIVLETGDTVAIEPDSLIVLSRRNGFLQLDLQHGRLMANIKSSKVKINLVDNGRKEAVESGTGLMRVEHNQLNKALADNQKLNAAPLAEANLEEALKKRYFEPPPGYKGLDQSKLSFPENTVIEENLFKGQKAQFKLHWLDPLHQWTGYDVEVSRTPDFKELVVSRELSAPELPMISGLPGLFYYKVRGLNGTEKKSNWSDPQQALLKINWRERGSGVQITQNKLGYELKNEDLPLVTAGRIYKVSPQKPIRVEWSKNEDAEQYRVLVSDQKDFENIIEEKIVTQNEINLETVRIGKSFVKIIPETKEGIVVAEESLANVVTLFPPPQKSRFKTKRISTEQVLLDWTNASPAPAYEVTYTSDQEGQNKVTQYVEAQNLKIDNQTGFVQWKVRAVEPESKSELSRYSETVDWYDKAKKLASIEGAGSTLPGQNVPQIISPAARKTFIASNNSPVFMVVSWSYPEEATAYNVEISKSPDMKQIYYQKEVQKKKQLIINQKFQPGVYFMRVRAKHSDVTQEAWSAVEPFRVLNR